MDYIRKRTHVINHVRFLEAGPIARDLYDWGMLWSGQQETDGEIPMAAVLASAWGYGSKRNVVVADRLVAVGLWERTDTGYRILRWAEQGNLTKATLEAKRATDRDRKRGVGKTKIEETSATLPRDFGGGQNDAVPTNSGESGNPPRGFPSSSSYSPSSPAGSDPRRSDQPDRSPTPPASGPTPPVEVGPAPDWWAAAVATAEQAVGTIDQPGARWLEYDASRERKGWARGQRDAVGWLTAVARAERTRARAGPRGDAAVTRQPFDPEAPWIKLGDTGS